MGRGNRRAFLRTTAAVGASICLSTAGGARVRRAAAEPLKLAIIGCGGKGRSNLEDLAAQQIVALCDVDAERAAEAFAKYPDVPRYQDFRKLLEERPEVEAVVVSTPDHTHAAACVTAMRLGKHVYCETPLARSVYEARLMRDVARESGVITQMGNQGTANENFRRAVEVVQSGAIGPVSEVHVWTNRPIWPQGMARPSEMPEVPAHLEWDLWLGPSAERPYHPCYVPFAWRGWWEFGTGALGDMACHTANLAFMALSLGAPTAVEAQPQENTDETGPKSATVVFEFPARGEQPPVKLTWYEGGGRPSQELADGMNLPESGLILVGAKGRLFSPDDYGARYKLLPEQDFAGYEPPAASLPRSPGHHQEWLDACRGGAAPLSNFEYAGPMTETILLGNVAMRVGKRLEWDSAGLKCPNCAEADPFLHPAFREGWGV